MRIVKANWVSAAFVFTVVVGLRPAGADTVFARCEGERQGEIRGDATFQGYENWINVFGFGHSIVSPRDPSTGQTTGRRQHQPLRLFKAVDRATPLLYLALVTGERLPKCEIHFLRNDVGHGGSGAAVHYFTIEIRNASIADITAAAGGDGGGIREVVSFVYEKIIWTYEDGGITAEDDWLSPNP